MNPRTLVLATALAVSPCAIAAPCAGFNDVPDTDPFCHNVEWIKNRGVTLGCNTGLYCPAEAVTRLHMAAFMNRLGTALTPSITRVELPSGALDLDVTPVVCQTADQPIASYPRRALLDASVSATAASGVDIGVRLVYSTNAGVNWQPIGTVQNAQYVPAVQWGQAADVAVLDLDVGQSVRFGLQVSRAGAGSVDLSDSRCVLREQLMSRDGASSPF